jgi:gas vesicle protein
MRRSYNMRNDYDSDGFSGLAFFLLGAVTGAAVTLLFAPMSGERTREYLGNSARQAREQVAAAAGKARDLAERGRQAAVVTMDEWRPKVEEAVAQGRQAFDRAGEAMKQAGNGEV